MEERNMPVGNVEFHSSANQEGTSMRGTYVRNPWLKSVFILVLLLALAPMAIAPTTGQAAPALAPTITNDDPALTAGWKKVRSGWTRDCSGIDRDAYWTYSRRPGRSGDVDSARWEVSLPQSGLWEVQAYIPGVGNGLADTRNAQYRVGHASGETLVPVSQRGNWCRWISLGTYTFNVGRAAYVYLGDFTGGENPQTSVVADAVRWVYRGDGGTPPNVADHFDWPVNPPNGDGWGTKGWGACGVGYGWLDWACVERDGNGNCTKHEYHPGVDLNKCSGKDKGKPVYAVANAVVVGDPSTCSILLEHTLPDGTKVWSNYKHVVPSPGLKAGDIVHRGGQIGTIEDNHLHFEIRTRSAESWPGCSWAVGLTKEQVKQRYTPPMAFLSSHR